jgi:hypothetical protein
MIEKVLLIVSLAFGVSAILGGAYISWQGSKINNLTLKYEESVLAVSKANTAILNQNALIEAYALDLETAKEEVRVETRYITEYAEKEKIKIVDRLIKDDSCEEKLRIIEEQVNAFLTAD